MVLVAEGVHIGLVFGLLPHHLLDHLLPNIQVLLVSMTLNQLPWVSVDLLFAHFLRKKLGQILSVVIILRSGLLLLLHRVKLVEQSLIDARVHLWLHLSWTYLFRHLMNSLALLPLKELLNIIYFLLALPYNIGLYLLLLVRVRLDWLLLLLLLWVHFRLLLEIEELGETFKLVLEVHVLDETLLIHRSWSVHIVLELLIDHLKASVSVWLHSLILEYIDLLKKLVVVRAERVAAWRVVLVRGAVLGLDVVVLNDLLDLGSGVLEVSLCAETLWNDCDMIIIPSSIKFILYSTNIDFFLIDHNHHLYNIECIR